MSDKPAPLPPSPDRPFEIGLVMAGAISAGAYTAGVVDFLLQALDEWEKAKAHARAHPDDPSSRDCPKHEVRIKVIAGASAGGMTAGLAAGMLGMKYESVTRQTSPDSASPPIVPTNNNLYRSWVNTIDIVPLLGTDDLDTDATIPVQSVLDSTIIRTIAAEAFRYDQPKETLARPYVSDALHVFLTVTNLRGIPYPVTFTNYEKIPEYNMMLHADNMHFVVSKDATQAGPDAFWLKPHDFQEAKTWGVLQDSAIATGAFPVGLAAQPLKRPPAQYDSREWAIPKPCSDDPACTTDVWKAIPPLWPTINAAVASAAKTGKPFEYEFLCVDGGVTNNEPLDLARRILAGADGVNPREGDKATRAVIMVMPFPNAGPFEVEYSSQLNLAGLLATIFGSLISQARFKPEELTLADDPDVYSRFLIVPRRGYRDDSTLEPYAIACGSLEGFGGFLSRRFREHDYQLGRRNCQWFLKQYFVLPSKGDRRNKLFDNWTDEARARHRVVMKRPATATSPARQVDLDLLPIIPLMGAAAPNVPKPVWPTYLPGDFAALRPKVKKRLRRVVWALIDQNVAFPILGPPFRWALKFIWWIMSGQVVGKIMQAIKADLTTRGLMR
jgi:Patatin-like phospholipase